MLVDECVDWRILRNLSPHDAKTVKQLGWKGGDDRSLLARAAADFDIFLTVDTKLPDQQNIAALVISPRRLPGRSTAMHAKASTSAIPQPAIVRQGCLLHALARRSVTPPSVSL